MHVLKEGVDLDVGFSNITGEERFQEKSGLPGGVVFQAGWSFAKGGLSPQGSHHSGLTLG